MNLPGGTGRYELVTDAPPVQLPAWLGSLLTTPQAALPSLECPQPGGERAHDIDQYVATALKREGERVSGAVEGGRNAALNKAAYHLGQFIGAGGTRRRDRRTRAVHRGEHPLRRGRPAVHAR